MRAGRRRDLARLAPQAGALIAAISLLLGAASPAAAFTKSIWGPLTRNGIDQFPLYQRLGVGILQEDLRWSDVARRRPAHPMDPSDPAYTWPATIDTSIALAARHRMRILLQVIGSPSWENGGHSANWIPGRPDEFAAFAAAASRRYPGVRLWMIWGEPTKAENFAPLSQQPPGVPLTPRARRFPRLYATMLEDSYAALKRVSRANTVIGGCTYSTGAIDALAWISNLRLADGRPPRMDMYAHNPFSYEDPTFRRHGSPFNGTQFSDLPRLAGWVDRYLRRGMPLFLSEWTIPTAPDAEFNFWVDPPVAARWIREALAESRRWHRIAALGWINVFDELPLSAGGLLTADGTAKPSFAAFQKG